MLKILSSHKTIVPAFRRSYATLVCSLALFTCILPGNPYDAIV